MRSPVLATGWSLYLPGVLPGEAVAEHLGAPGGSWAETGSPPPAEAAAVLGRKGLLGKEPATRLALCAVHRALGFPPGRGRGGADVDPRTAVVACGNLGNAGTVADVARAAAAGQARSVSVLDAPNVSGNVIASTVALRHGFGGPNLMVCSGAAAGFDGLRLAALLLRAGRADRVVLVGAEPADGTAAGLHAASLPPPHPPLRAGAACLVLTRAANAPGRAVLIQDLPDDLPDDVPGDLPGDLPGGTVPRAAIGPGGFDPAAHWGDHHGAGGVVALALAAHLAADEGFGAVAVRHASPDGSDAALVRPAGGEGR